MQIAQENITPVMLYALGAGPLNASTAQNLVREVLNEVAVITVRDRDAQRLLESIGFNKQTIVIADPALLIKPEPLPKKVLISVKIKKKHNLIGMSVREHGVAAPDLDEKLYHGLLANAADFMVDRMDADIITPMERKALDLQHSHAIISQMLKPQRAWVFSGEYTPGQRLSIMSN